MGQKKNPVSEVSSFISEVERVLLGVGVGVLSSGVFIEREVPLYIDTVSCDSQSKVVASCNKHRSWHQQNLAMTPLIGKTIDQFLCIDKT